MEPTRVELEDLDLHAQLAQDVRNAEAPERCPDDGDSEP
jgi:hypothetical protein